MFANYSIRWNTDHTTLCGGSLDRVIVKSHNTDNTQKVHYKIIKL